MLLPLHICLTHHDLTILPSASSRIIDAGFHVLLLPQSRLLLYAGPHLIHVETVLAALVHQLRCI